MTPDDKEARIRVRAHLIWESEGRPDDRSEVHWEIATRIIEEEDAASLPDTEDKLDEAGEESFPASDPPSMTQPTKGIVSDPEVVTTQAAPKRRRKSS
jgi:hypothetical protein